MPTIIIDGKPYEVGEGRNVLQAALDNKLDLPYFCWHPAMGSVGACRLCAVKHYRDENDEHGRLAMGCMTPATEGTRVAIDEPEAVQFRRSVIEWLMINHPHDCPVCDEGGECHLQDMTIMTGHANRRYRGDKRTHRNQYLGPFIHHEMNRCIQCYRCTRFYCDHTGGDDLGAFASRNRVYFGRVEDGVLESPFAGNLVEVCPTGVFTDKTLRKHYTRKWDLQSAPSICSHCSLGCNTIMGARYGSIRRVTSRFNGDVNGYWLCDRGRFGYEYLTTQERILNPVSLQPDTQPPVPDDDAIRAAAAEEITSAAAAGTLATVGSPRTSLESNFALRTLAPQRFCNGIADEERDLVAPYLEALRAERIHVPSLQEVEEADVIVVLGTDLTNEAPLLDLAAYRALDNGAAVFVIALNGGRLEGFASDFERADPARTAARATELAAELCTGGSLQGIAERLAAAERPLLISSTQHRTPEIVDAALKLAAAVSAASNATTWFTMALSEVNTFGAVLGDENSLSVNDLVSAIERNDITTLVVGENDLFARFQDHPRLVNALQQLDALVVLDHVITATMQAATYVLPSAPLAECTGTVVNNEGRMQRHYEVVRPQRGIAPMWSVVHALAPSVEGAAGGHVDNITATLEATQPLFAGISSVAPPAGFRHAHQAIPRMSARYSGRNATLDADALDGLAAIGPGGELPVVQRSSADPETPLSFSMEGFSKDTPTPLLPRVWTPGWNSNEAINQFQIEVGGPLHGGDPGRRMFPPVSGSGNATDDRAAATAETHARAANFPAVDAADEFLVCAQAQIFGSEVTSRLAPAVAELALSDHLVVHPRRASALGVEPGQVRDFRFTGGSLEVTVNATLGTDDSLPEHVALIPAGYPATRWWQQPLAMKIQAAEVAS